MNKNVLICPVCQKTVFEHMYSYEICRYCGWENDNYFEEGGANGLSFEEYKTLSAIFRGGSELSLG